MPRLTFYGGVKEIGGNKVLLEDEDLRLFFDFGTPYGKRGEFFEEYLTPRPGAGLMDLLEMDLLPPLKGIYREDLAQHIPWEHFQAHHPHYGEVEAQAVLLSHAHLDHSGYISFLRPETAIYTSPMTAFIAKAMQDAGKSDMERELCYLSPREMRQSYLATAGKSYLPRTFVLTGPFPTGDEAQAFWCRSPAKTKVLKTPLPTTINTSTPLRFFPVDHSVFGAGAFAVETSEGWVAYTGDLRLHGARGHLTQASVQSLAALKPLALISEGTRAGEEKGTTEEEVYENILSVAKGAPGLLIADFSPRNIERLLTMEVVARQTARRLVVLPKDMYLLEAMALACPQEVPPGLLSRLLIYQEFRSPDREEVWREAIRQHNPSRFVGPQEVRACPQEHTLCFSFWDINELIDIHPQGGTYIYSSSEAFNEEQRMDIKRLKNWLKHFDIDAVGLPDEETGKIPPEQKGFHASGHASGPELLGMIKEIQPEVLVPIHTEKPTYFLEGLAGTGIEVRLPQLGKATEL
jgi:ribonuclease J